MPQRARSRARPPGLRPCPGTRTGRPWGWRENATAAAHRPGPRPAYRGRRRPPPHHAALQARDTAWSAAAAPGLPNALPWHPEGDRQQRHWEHRLRFRARLRASRRHPWGRSVALAARRSRDAFVQDHGRRDQRAWEHEPPEFHARYLHTGAVECGLLPLRHATRATGATRAIRADGLHGPATRPGTGAHGLGPAAPHVARPAGYAGAVARRARRCHPSAYLARAPGRRHGSRTGARAEIGRAHV